MKIAKISIFSLAAAVFVTAVVLFFVYTIHAPMAVGELGEVLGWLLAACMGIMMLIFVLKMIFMSKKSKPELKAKLAPVYKVANQFHMPVGALAVALLYCHFALVYDIHDPSWIHFITGYILAGLLASIVAFGFVAYFNKTPKRKVFTLIHQILVAVILVVFIIHLILK
jgi:hypothetical protein